MEHRECCGTIMHPFRVDFIGIGAPRCGTTWLYKCLDAHPDICMSRPKELNFFQGGALPFSTWSLGDTWYASRFPHPERRVHGEISPRYFDSPTAAKRIKERFPNCKILVNLRHPADALYSLYRYIFNWWIFEPTFEEFIERHPEYVQTFQYADHLPTYLSLFGSDHVHVIRYEDILSAPAETLRSIFDFLGVDSIEPPQTHTYINVRRSNARWYATLHTRLTTMLLPTNIPVRFYGLIKFVDALAGHVTPSRHEPSTSTHAMDPQTRTRLIERYRASNDKLEELLGRDFSDWNA